MTPPRRAALYSLELEEELLGSMLLSPEVCSQALEKLTVEDFGDERTRCVFGVMAKLGQDISTARVIAGVREVWRGDPGEVTSYVLQLREWVDLPSKGHGTIADLEKLRKRRGLEDASRLLAKAAESEDVEEAVELVRLKLAPEPSSNGHRPTPKPRPEYPLDVFPAAIVDYIEQTAISVCVAPEAIATSVLVACAGAIGNARWLAVKDDWHVRPGLYAGLVAPVSERKSPAVEVPTQPISRIQAEHDVRYHKALEEWEATPGNKRKPLLSGPLLQQVTTESVGVALEAHPRGVILIRDELVGWVKSFGQYKHNQGDDRQQWLEFYNGKDYRVRRVSREPVVIRSPAVSILGGIQPKVFDTLTAVDDGLAERFLYCVMPKVRVDASTPAASRQIRGTYEAIVRALYELQDGEMPLCEDGCLTEARQRILDDAERFSGRMRAYYLKGEGLLPRLSIVLAALWAVCDGHDEIVSPSIVGHAEALWRFYADQGARLFDGDEVVVPTEFERAGPANVRALLDWLAKEGGTSTRRDATQRGPLQRMSAREVETVISTACARGELEARPGKRKDSLILTLRS